MKVRAAAMAAVMASVAERIQHSSEDVWGGQAGIGRLEQERSLIADAVSGSNLIVLEQV